jgi:hypothetical protein
MANKRTWSWPFLSWISNRKSIETRGYPTCMRGRSPWVLIRLSSVLMFFLFCIIVKHVPCCHNMKLREKVTNERVSEYDISVAFPFSSVTISKPQQKWANQWACSGVRVTNIQFNSDTFSTERPPNYDTTYNNVQLIIMTFKKNSGFIE